MTRAAQVYNLGIGFIVSGALDRLLKGKIEIEGEETNEEDAGARMLAEEHILAAEGNPRLPLVQTQSSHTKPTRTLDLRISDGLSLLTSPPNRISSLNCAKRRGLGLSKDSSKPPKVPTSSLFQKLQLSGSRPSSCSTRLSWWRSRSGFEALVENLLSNWRVLTYLAVSHFNNPADVLSIGVVKEAARALRVEESERGRWSKRGSSAFLHLNSNSCIPSKHYSRLSRLPPFPMPNSWKIGRSKAPRCSFALEHPIVGPNVTKIP